MMKKVRNFSQQPDVPQKTALGYHFSLTLLFKGSRVVSPFLSVAHQSTMHSTKYSYEIVHNTVGTIS